MRVIPVIDVRGGEVVRAVRGDRASYRPILTPLADGSDPVAVAAGFRRLYPFADFYIADLDGIERGTPDRATVRRVAEANPGVTVWVDNGAATAEAVAALLAIPGTIAVIGSETLRDPAELAAASRAAPDRVALSLDFRDEAFVGLPELLARPEAWPRRVIVMTLARVGSDEGPDIARIRAIAAVAGASRMVIAAGGVRAVGDLVAARDAGARGALVATALHAGTIKADDLGKVAGLDVSSSSRATAVRSER